MKKIKFGDRDTLGRLVREPKANEKKYDLLAFFISDTKYSLDESIEELEIVQSGGKTLDEVTENTIWSFGEGAGVFSCDKETVYFKAEHSEFQDMEMPLQELIDLLQEWKYFLGE